MYDARYARWFNVDPMAQHHSPYLAMSNNPVSFVDPTGGWSFGYGDYQMDKDNGPIEAWDMHSTVDYSIDIGGGINPADWMQNGKGWNYMSRADRIAMQNANGTSYEAQYWNKVRTLAELGGYRSREGHLVKYHNGKLGFDINYAEATTDAGFSSPNLSSFSLVDEWVSLEGIAATYDAEKVVNTALSHAEKYQYKYGEPARPINSSENQTYFDCSAWLFFAINQVHPDLGGVPVRHLKN